MSELKSHGQIIIDTAAARNNKTFPVGGFTADQFGPNEDSSKPGEYSAVLIGDGLKVEGEVTVTYDRLNLGTVVDAATGGSGLAIRSSGSSAADVAALIRTELGVNLLDSDIEEASFGPFEVIQDVTLSAADDSKLFRGDVVIKVGPMTGEGTGTTLVNNGREPLYPTTNIVEASLANDAPLPPTALKGDGTLLIGSGNPNGQFVSVNNGELTIAMGARVYQQGSNLPVPDFEAYNFSIEDTQDWNFLYSFSVDGAPAGKRLIDMYDIEMSWVQQSTQHAIVWTLQEQGGNMVLVSDDDNMVIVDNASNAAGTALQNIQRMRHYIENQDQTYFSPDNLNSFGSLMGDFVFTVSATRKNSLADPLHLSVLVTVFLAEEEVPE